MVWGVAVGGPGGQERERRLRRPRPLRQSENHLGQSGGSATAYPVGMGRHHVRERFCGLVGGARGEYRTGMVVDGDGGSDHLENAGPLPIGQVPAHRHRDGTDLPAAQCGQHQLFRVGNPQCHKRTELCAGGSQRPTPLIGPAIQVREGHRLRGTVACDDGHSCVVATLFGKLTKLGAERDFLVWRIGGGTRHGLCAHADTGLENNVSSPPPRTVR